MSIAKTCARILEMGLFGDQGAESLSKLERMDKTEMFAAMGLVLDHFVATDVPDEGEWVRCESPVMIELEFPTVYYQFGVARTAMINDNPGFVERIRGAESEWTAVYVRKSHYLATMSAHIPLVTTTRRKE